MKFGMKSCALGCLLASPAFAQGLDNLSLSGEVELGARYYFDDGAYFGQSDTGLFPYSALRFNGDLSLEQGDIAVEIGLFGDELNDRSVLNIQRLYYTNSYDTWDFLVGYNVEDWGVSNGRTIVNVLNSRDRANQFANSELLGTPMANVNFFTQIGTFSLYALPGDTIENFAGFGSRLRGPLYTDDDLAAYQTDDPFNFALRFSNNYSLGEGALDVSASFYMGADRESVGLIGCNRSGGAVDDATCGAITAASIADFEGGNTAPSTEAEITDFLTTNFGAAVAADAVNRGLLASAPYYQDITQFGLTTVYSNGNTQLRFEGFVRDTDFETFEAAIVGGDYTFNDFLGGPGTMIVSLEYHHDSRSDRQPVTAFADDVFLGAAYSANDANDTRVNGSLFYDVDGDAELYSFGASRRLGDNTTVGVNATYVNASGADDPLVFIDNDSFVEFSLSIFF